MSTPTKSLSRAPAARRLSCPAMDAPKSALEPQVIVVPPCVAPVCPRARGRNYGPTARQKGYVANYHSRPGEPATPRAREPHPRARLIAGNPLLGEPCPGRTPPRAEPHLGRTAPRANRTSWSAASWTASHPGGNRTPGAFCPGQDLIPGNHATRFPRCPPVHLTVPRPTTIPDGARIPRANRYRFHV